jgi:hypothetical protein
MSICKDTYARLRAIAGSEERDELYAAADLLPLEDLVAIWRELQTAPRLLKGEEHHFFDHYFNFSFVDDATGRVRCRNALHCLAFVEAEAALEPDEEILALCGDAVVGPLFRRVDLLAALPDFVENSPERERLCRLLGAGRKLVENWRDIPEVLRTRLLPLCDADGFERWNAAHWRPYPMDFDRAPPAVLAAAYVEEAFRSAVERARDDLWRRLSDRLRELRQSDPETLLDVVVEIERRDDRDELRAYLAAGELEDLVCDGDPAVVAAMEAEAARNEGFKDLLVGVWLHRASPDVAARIEAARGGLQW